MSFWVLGKMDEMDMDDEDREAKPWEIRSCLVCGAPIEETGLLLAEARNAAGLLAIVDDSMVVTCSVACVRAYCRTLKRPA
jgi:hypothetical protein